MRRRHTAGRHRGSALVALAAALLLASSADGRKSPRRRRIEVQGHRGARAVRPENTLAGFRHAIALGVDTLELDVHASKDDRLVVIHDPWIGPARCRRRDGRPLRRRWAVRALPLARIQRFDCGSLRHPRFPRQRPVRGARIPTLDQVLRLARGPQAAARRLRFNIELKSVPGAPQLSPTPARFGALLVRALKRHRLLARASVQSFDYRTLAAVRKLAPSIAIAVLTAGNSVDYVAVARRYRATTLSPKHQWITAADVRALHRIGVRVIPWTVNRPAQWRRLLRIGVDGMITDDPGALIRWLRARGRR